MTQGETILNDGVVHQREERHRAELVVAQLPVDARQALLGEGVLGVGGHAETVAIAECRPTVVEHLQEGTEKHFRRQGGGGLLLRANGTH